MFSPAQQVSHEATLLPFSSAAVTKRQECEWWLFSGRGSPVGSHTPTHKPQGSPLISILSEQRSLNTACWVVWPAMPVFLGWRRFSDKSWVLQPADGRGVSRAVSGRGSWETSSAEDVCELSVQMEMLLSNEKDLRREAGDQAATVQLIIRLGQLGSPGLLLHN